MTTTQTPRFLQIHTLTSYPASLLNRDDAGFAKRIPFGGVSRTRISSQCLKRHWRTFQGEHALAELNQPGSIRSRYTFERYVIQPLIAEGKNERLVRAVVEALLPALLGKSDKAKKEEAEGEKKKKKDAAGVEQQVLQTGQVTVLGRPEVDYIRKLTAVLCDRAQSPERARGTVDEQLKKSKELKENLQNIPLAAGLDAALFGRMVTSDLMARGDAALHVAHAFTVHEEQSETDYFSAVDDLEAADGKLGSGHINSAELTSGLFYGYVVVDVPLLVSNLTGCDRKDWLSADRKLAGDVIERLPGGEARLYGSPRQRSSGAGRGGERPALYPGQRLPLPGQGAPGSPRQHLPSSHRVPDGAGLHVRRQAPASPRCHQAHEGAGRSRRRPRSAGGGGGLGREVAARGPWLMSSCSAWMLP